MEIDKQILVILKSLTLKWIKISGHKSSHCIKTLSSSPSSTLTMIPRGPATRAVSLCHLYKTHRRTIKPVYKHSSSVLKRRSTFSTPVNRKCCLCFWILKMTVIRLRFPCQWKTARSLKNSQHRTTWVWRKSFWGWRQTWIKGYMKWHHKSKRCRKQTIDWRKGFGRTTNRLRRRKPVNMRPLQV